MGLKKETYNTIVLALPIIFGELAQMMLHLIDNAMIGALSHVQLAASSLVLNVMNIPFVFGIGITMSIAQMVSMAQGSNDDKKVSHYFFNGFWVSAIFAIAIAAAMYLGRNIILSLNQDPEVAILAIPFLKVMSLSLVPMLLFMALKQFTDGLQFTRTAMILSVLSLPMNILLNYVLIYGKLGFPRMEMMGAAYATLITRSVIFIVLAWVVLTHKTFAPYIKLRKEQWYFSKKAVQELLRIGLPSGMQIGMEAGAFAISGIIIGTLGAVPQAAHQITLSCAAFTFMVSMGLAQAGSIRVSNAYGAGEMDKIKVIGKSTLLTALAYGVFCALFFVAFRSQLPPIFNQNPEVVALASSLFILAAFFQISDASQAVGAGLLRGIKDVKVPTMLIFVAYWILGIPAGYYMAFHCGMGAKGIWLGFIVGLTFSSLFLCWRFMKLTKRSA
jgi:MATE family multidrug resistance protein